VLAARPTVRSDFDRYDDDGPLDRVLKAAAQRLLAAPALSPDSSLTSPTATSASAAQVTSERLSFSLTHPMG